MKGQSSQVVLFIFIVIVMGLIILFGFKAVQKIRGAGEATTEATFINDLQHDLNSVQRLFNTQKTFSYATPNKAFTLCFVASCTDNCSQVFQGTPESVEAFAFSSPQQHLYFLDSQDFVVRTAALGAFGVDWHGDGNEETFHCERNTGRLRVSLVGKGDHAVLQNAR